MERKRLLLVGGLSATAIVLALDLILGVAGWISWLLTCLQVIAALPWTAEVLGRPWTDLPPFSVRALTGSRTRTPAGKFQALLISLFFVALLFGALLLKGVLLSTGIYTRAELSELYRTYTAMAIFVAAIGYVGRGQRTLWFFGQLAEYPSRMLAASFVVLSVLGAFFLATPFALSDPTKGSFIDALFDATGALCGALSISDVGRHYQPFGQFVIFVLMQVGGFGIMVLSASIAILASRKLEVRSTARFAEIVDADSLSDLRATVFRIVRWTLAIEAIGAVVLYFLFDRPGISAHPLAAHPLAGGGSPLWSAVFHSVSAFCNAGFSLFRGNLAPFVADPAVNVVIDTLIVLGGLGFPVLSELTQRLFDLVTRRPRKRLSLHARVVLAMTGGMIAVGALSLLILEWGRSLAHLPIGGRVLAAFFQSITARTAGFSSVDFAAFGGPAMLVMIALMFIGAGPGSTGGGIKVTTFAVLFATFRAERSSAPAPTLFGREIPAAVQRKAIVVTILSAVFVVLSVFFVILFEDVSPFHAFFEATSAFASVGCSTGIEANMGAAGKLVLIVTMIIGRIGPLTFAIAAASKPRATTYRLPEERVMIG